MSPQNTYPWPALNISVGSDARVKSCTSRISKIFLQAEGYTRCQRSAIGSTHSPGLSPGYQPSSVYGYIRGETFGDSKARILRVKVYPEGDPRTTEVRFWRRISLFSYALNGFPDHSPSGGSMETLGTHNLSIVPPSGVTTDSIQLTSRLGAGCRPSWTHANRPDTGRPSLVGLLSKCSCGHHRGWVTGYCLARVAQGPDSTRNSPGEQGDDLRLVELGSWAVGEHMLQRSGCGRAILRGRAWRCRDGKRPGGERPS